MDNNEHDLCDMSGFNTLELLGKKHVLPILKVLGEARAPLRYQEINEILKINTRTLTERLKELEQFRIVKRTSYDQIPPRVEYSLTDASDDLILVFEAIYNFEKKHLQKYQEVSVKTN